MSTNINSTEVAQPRQILAKWNEKAALVGLIFTIFVGVGEALNLSSRVALNQVTKLENVDGSAIAVMVGLIGYIIVSLARSRKLE